MSKSISDTNERVRVARQEQIIEVAKRFNAPYHFESGLVAFDSKYIMDLIFHIVQLEL